MLALQRPLVFLDLETTGLAIDEDRIVEIGMVRLEPDGSRVTLVERIDPGIEIPEQATRVHGIRTDDVRGLFGKPKLGRLGEKLLDFLGAADLGGFNAISFDLPLFEVECRRHGIPFARLGRCLIDAKTIFHRMETSWDRFLMGPRNLSAAVRMYCGRELEGAHSAGADAEAALDVLLAQLTRYPELPRTVTELHEFCARAAASMESRQR